jgi:hypothetical protein
MGDFPMGDVEKLRRALPPFADLIIGNIAETVHNFIASNVAADASIGFLSVDVDYYSSAKSCLKILTADPRFYLPVVPVYLDDIESHFESPWTGELLAVNEFNSENTTRKIAPFTFLRSRRLFKNAMWIEKMFAAHIFEHELRSPPAGYHAQQILPNYDI